MSILTNANLQLSAYSEGEAAGILLTIEALNPHLKEDKQLMKQLYKQTLLLIGKSEDTATYWVNFFFGE